jgi:hypothetical protein
LVTDLPADFETFGQAVATSMADLLGGTSGQILSKASNTDMDFTWVTTDDANAIQNSIVDAKGDIVAASANDTPARLAVGNNGETLVADSSTSTGLRWQGDYAAGKNKVINGDFGIWQRGTSIAYTGSGATTFTADRCSIFANGNGTFTFSRQTFTAGAAPVAGYEGQYFYRSATNTLGTSTAIYHLQNNIENVQTFAGQTVTFSFWAKSDAARTLNLALIQNFGSGGSSPVTITSSVSVTTSWVRYTYTVALASISGKTIGTGSYLQVRLDGVPTASQTMDIWGLQLEASSAATPFQTATGTIQGELAACQRYYQRVTAEGAYGAVTFTGNANSTTQARIPFATKQTFRVKPTSVDYANVVLNDGTNVPAAGTITVGGDNANAITLLCTTTGLTQFRPYVLTGDNNVAGFVGLSAEL